MDDDGYEERVAHAESLAARRWESQEAAFARLGVEDLVGVDPDRFEGHSWEFYDLEYHGQDLRVPKWFRMIARTSDGWVVRLRVVVGPDGPVVIERTEIRESGASGHDGTHPVLVNDDDEDMVMWRADVSTVPRFPIRRWVDEAIVKAHMDQLSRDARVVSHAGSIMRPRTNSPSAETLAEVRRLKDDLELSYQQIADRMGKSRATAHRWYKRAKEARL